MKVARWKVLGLAGVLALGYVATVDAAQIKVSDDTWANFGLQMKIFYKNLDKRSNASSGQSGDWRQNEFSVNNARIYFAGQVNKLWQFYGEFDMEHNEAVNIANIHEAAVNLAFAKEFQILAGKIRRSFTRADVWSDYNSIIPTSVYCNPQAARSGIIGNLFQYPANSNAGAMIHGDLAGGMFTYRVGVYNNDQRSEKNKGLEFAARVEFQPLMLGFKPVSAATINTKVADTYLGEKDIFTIGVGYMSKKKQLQHFNGTAYDSVKPVKDKTIDGWTVDAIFEKKFGDLVPNLQAGYVKISDTHANAYDNSQGRIKSEDSDAWYVQGQLLYDQVVGFGKPAIAFRFDTIKNDNAINIGTKADDAKYNRWGVAFNYYIKGQAARISLGFDNVKYKDGSKYTLKYFDPKTKYEDSITDWYLYLQTQF